MSAPKSPEKRNSKKIVQNTAYLGMAYQIFGLLAITIFFGLKADKHFQNDNQYITVLAAFVILVLYFYKLYITLNKQK